MAIAQLAAEFMLGFIVALWVGFILGLIEGWKPKVMLGILVVFGVSIALNVILNDPSTVAADTNWVFVTGTLPGYILSIPTGKHAYQHHVE